jgi:hypothetical protein
MEKEKLSLKEQSKRIVQSDAVRVVTALTLLGGWVAANVQASKLWEDFQQDLHDQKRWTDEEDCLRWLTFEPSDQQSDLFAQAEDMKTEHCEDIVSDMKFDHVLVMPSSDGR